MKAVAFGLLLTLLLSDGAAALDCGSPARERSKEWLSQQMQQGKLLLKATAEYAVVTKSEKETDFLEILITAHPLQVAGSVRAGDLLERDGKLYIRFDLFIDDNKRDLISKGFNSEWVAKLPSLWLVSGPKDYDVHGEQFRVVDSDSCRAMLIGGVGRSSPDAVEELKWQAFTK